MLKLNNVFQHFVFHDEEDLQVYYLVLIGDCGRHFGFGIRTWLSFHQSGFECSLKIQQANHYQSMATLNIKPKSTRVSRD